MLFTFSTVGIGTAFKVTHAAEPGRRCVCARECERERGFAQILPTLPGLPWPPANTPGGVTVCGKAHVFVLKWFL